MTKPQEPKRYSVNMMCGDVMYAEEALAYAEAVRNEAPEEAATLVEGKTGLSYWRTPQKCGGNLALGKEIRSLKREGK